jgi:hypothetical protein
MAMVRVMVEKVINAEYIFLTGTDSALDYVRYGAFREWRDFEEIQRLTPELGPNYSTEFLTELRMAHLAAMTRTLPNGATKSRFGRGTDWIDIGLSNELIKRRHKMREFNSTRILYQTAYKKSAGYLHGLWISIARSLKSEKSAKNPDADGMVEMTLGIRTRDEDPGVASKAMNLANLAAATMIFFAARVFGRKDYLDWAASFTESYVKELKSARETP